MEQNELTDLIEESNISSTNNLAPRRTALRRLLPRTRASERVRAVINRYRRERERDPIPRRILDDEDEVSIRFVILIL